MEKVCATINGATRVSKMVIRKEHEQNSHKQLNDE